MEEASTLLSKEEEEAMWKELLAKKKSGRQKRVKRVRSLGAKEKRRQEETRQKALKAHITKMHSFGVRVRGVFLRESQYTTCIHRVCAGWIGGTHGIRIGASRAAKHE